MNMKSQQKKLPKLQKEKKSFSDKCVMADPKRGGETFAK